MRALVDARDEFYIINDYHLWSLKEKLLTEKLLTKKLLTKKLLAENRYFTESMLLKINLYRINDLEKLSSTEPMILKSYPTQNQ